MHFKVLLNKVNAKEKCPKFCDLPHLVVKSPTNPPNLCNFNIMQQSQETI